MKLGEECERQHFLKALISILIRKIVLSHHFHKNLIFVQKREKLLFRNKLLTESIYFDTFFNNSRKKLDQKNVRIFCFFLQRKSTRTNQTFLINITTTTTTKRTWTVENMGGSVEFTFSYNWLQLDSIGQLALFSLKIHECNK